jgi:hypothetical protein
MRKKRRKSYTTAFKVKATLEAIKGQRTVNGIRFIRICCAA